MPQKDSKSLTEPGLKYIYQYLRLSFIFNLILLLVSVGLYLMHQDMSSISASKFYFIVAIVSLFIVIFIWFIFGVANVLNGRLEFDDPHESNVITGTILIVVYAVLYFINLLAAQGFTGGAAFITAASAGFSSSALLTLVAVLTISVASCVLLGLALRYLVQKLLSEEQMKRLKTAFILLVAGNFTFNITSLIAFWLYFKTYRDVHLKIAGGKLNAALIAPCPNCSREIPIEAKLCKFCGAKFERDTSVEIDPRLTFNVPDSQFKLRPGYTPVEGPTEEQKERLYYLIGLIILIIIVVAALVVILR